MESTPRQRKGAGDDGASEEKHPGRRRGNCAGLPFPLDPLRSAGDDRLDWRRSSMPWKRITMAGIAEPKVVSIPVCYGGGFGPDIGVVAEHTGLREDQIVAVHASVDYPIYMIGFTPGFCYWAGWIAVCRRPAGKRHGRTCRRARWGSRNPRRACIPSRVPAAGRSSGGRRCGSSPRRGKIPFCTRRGTVSVSSPSPRPNSRLHEKEWS